MVDPVRAGAHLGADVIVPDLAGWGRSRMMQLPETAAITMAPDSICEVISPSTEALDRVPKLRICARDGVRHLSLVTPRALLWTCSASRRGDGR
jgi:hypothetical protein